MKLLITGATGFIGSKLLVHLNNSENDIQLLSRKRHPDFQTFVCDFAKDVIPSKALVSIENVFHLAGYAHDLSDASKSKHLYQAINVDATIKLAKLAAKHHVKRFIFVSSVKAGGGAVAGQCMGEEDQAIPEGIYGKTKYEAETALLKIGRESGMFVSIIRPSLVYGPAVKGNLRMMLSGIQKGWFPPLPELNNRRSMIHIDDVVRAILFIATKPSANSEVFIATDGMDYSSHTIYKALCHSLDKPMPKWKIPKVVFDLIAKLHPNFRYKINKLLGDECYSSRKLKALGFSPTKTLDDINKTIYRKYS
jgi:nucleoside-diphosphate-sugar epimerase